MLVNYSLVYVLNLAGDWVREQRLMQILYGGIIEYKEVSEKVVQAVIDRKLELAKEKGKSQ